MVDSVPSITIESIKFKDKDDAISFNSDDIVLLVGANNVGKSRTLKDLQEDIIDVNRSKVLIDKIEYEERGFTPDQIYGYFERNFSKNEFGNYSITTNDGNTFYYSVPELENASTATRLYYKTLYSFLSTENRLNMTRPVRSNCQIDKNSLYVMRKLRHCSEAADELNNALKSGFNKSVDIFMDYDDGNAVMEYRIGSYDEINTAVNSTKDEWFQIIEQLDTLQSQGDGIRSAVAILATLIVSEHSLFLIDEPEAFLHPPQARIIGKNIVELSKGKQCFIATHNIDFIKGVVEADSSRVKVIKIDRSGNKNSFELIDNETITNIASDKNLKYTSILDGLFYNTLVLCENEMDCKFYAALLENTNLPRYQDTLFCAVGGKDQFKKVIPLLQKLSIQYLVIADIDLINNENSLRQLLDAIGQIDYSEISSIHHQLLNEINNGSERLVKTQQAIREEINSLFTGDTYMDPKSIALIKEVLKNASSLDGLKKGGRMVLPQGNCISWFDSIVSYLRENGVYIVECGEIERFVPSISGHGNKWLERVFEEHPDIEADREYDEAKKFVQEIFRSNC